MGLDFFFAIKEGTTFESVFSMLQEGLQRTLDMIPALDGKMMKRSEHEIGYKPGDICVTVPSRLQASARGQRSAPRQLHMKDLTGVLPFFSTLKEGEFMPSLYRKDLAGALGESRFPVLPADILLAQANFIEGGCILSLNLSHVCIDGVGFITAMRVWAEQCRYVQGDLSATCSWYDPESFNHRLPEMLYEYEGYAKPAEEVDPGVWGFIPFVPHEPLVNGAAANSTSKITSTLPPVPVFPHRFIVPPPPAERGLDTTLFRISSEQMQALKQQVMDDTAGVITSASDIVQAFLWRSGIRARYQVAKELHGSTFSQEDISILELPVDGRPYFSPLLPESYMGTMLIINRPNLPLETLVSPSTTVGQVARVLREAASRVTPSLVHDAFTLLQSLPDYTRYTTACMGLEGMHAMISNMMLFPTSDICFGDKFLDQGGSPLAMRPQIEEGHFRFRFLVIFPLREDGGVDLMFGTFPEELEMLQRDEEFTKYTTLIGYCR
jgi:hypothetical protein